MKYCTNCGMKLRIEKFCIRCGTPVHPNQEIISDREKYTITKDTSSGKYTTYLKDFSVKAAVEAMGEVTRGTTGDKEGFVSIESPSLYFSDGLLLYNNFPNRQEDALACFEKVIKLNPNHAEAWLYKGQINLKKSVLSTPGHFNLKLLELALESFNKVLDISLEREIEQRIAIDALNGKAQTLIGMKKRKDLSNLIQKVLELDPKNIQAQYVHSRFVPSKNFIANYEDFPFPVTIFTYVEFINRLKSDLLREEIMVGVGYEPMKDIKEEVIKSDKEWLIQNLPERTEELVSLIQNISNGEGCERLINYVGKPLSIEFNKNRIEKVDLGPLLFKSTELVQIFPYDEIIIYISAEFSRKDKPAKQLYLKNPVGIQLKDIEYALDLLSPYEKKEEYLNFGNLTYFHDYKGIPVYFCNVVFISYMIDFKKNHPKPHRTRKEREELVRKRFLIFEEELKRMKEKDDDDK